MEGDGGNKLLFYDGPLTMILISFIFDLPVGGFDKPIDRCSANTKFPSHFLHSIFRVLMNNLNQFFQADLSDGFHLSSILSFNMSSILSAMSFT